MPAYSFGEDSPVKFEIPDKLAQNYNEAVEQFLKAQRRFNQKFGRSWDPVTEPIKIKWSKHQRKAWNKIADVVNTYIDANGPISSGEYLDDFLVKSTVSVAAVASTSGTRLITMAVVAGTLYELLRGL